MSAAHNRQGTIGEVQAVSLFLDVDGVLLPYTDEGYNSRLILPTDGRIPGSGWTEWETTTVSVWGKSKRVSFSRQMGAALAGLKAEITFVSTWNPEANIIGNLVGLPQLESMGLAWGSKPWKAFAIEDWATENPQIPFIWIDDDAIGDWERKHLRNHGAPVLLITPFVETCLTPEHITQIQEFIDSCSQ